MAKKKPKSQRGRPRKPAGQVRDLRLDVRVRPSERAAYEETAAADGRELANWVRFVLNRAVEAAK